MIINGKTLLLAKPIKDMLNTKHREHGVSHGLGEAGFDIRIKQDVVFNGKYGSTIRHHNEDGTRVEEPFEDRFVIASAIEEFQMPTNMVGIVHDKSTWARRGLSVFNTVIEPGFFGGLTLELVYHGNEELVIPAGSGIAQVIFHQLSQEAYYVGKYQGQSIKPEPARFE